ncbi:MAG: VCBS repeat-containing protein, partial [Cyclobacteriaceae bacterium]|nr:VCBS repeat-containing protein [Cyclobacteriaceae bacterium]
MSIISIFRKKKQIITYTKPYLTLLLFYLLLMIGACNRERKQFSLLDASETLVSFSNDLKETQLHNIMTYEYMYNGAGVAVGDVNNDGLTDIYFSGNTVSNVLYLNKGNWVFEDITTRSNTAGRSDFSTGVTMADVNGDGWLDIYVCYSGNSSREGYNQPIIRDYPNRANQLFINQGVGEDGMPTFIESAKQYGLEALGTFSTQSYFLDYDLDGDLDMFLINHANMFYAAFLNTTKLRNLRHPYFGNKLYRNDDNTFVEVSEEAGIHGSGLNFGLSAAISDINMDGWPDIYVTNDYQEQDFCYINNKNGTFREVSHLIFSHQSKASMGSDIADINNDGLVDIVVLDMLPEDNYRQKILRGPDMQEKYALAVDSGFHHQYTRNTLQLNRGFAPDSLPRFSEIGQLSGISNTDWSWSSLLVDLDNDGLRDMFITNGFLRDITHQDFIKHTADVYKEAHESRSQVDYLKLIGEIPVSRVQNYLFSNRDGLHFDHLSGEWGFSQELTSNGAAYADFDNDGDYDLVLNNLNGVASLYRNNQETNGDNHFLRIKLKGPGKNTFGLGTKIYAITDSMEIYHEVFTARGYMSCVDPVMNVGLGKSDKIRELKVIWPDGNQQVLRDIPSNQLLEIEYHKDSNSEVNKIKLPEYRYFSEVTSTSGLRFKHEENKYVDFSESRLLQYQLSRLGGKLSVGDVNGDGNDDVFFGGAAGQRAALFLGTDEGLFTEADSSLWQEEAVYEDMESVMLDVDNDADLDLFVVSGGSVFKSGSSQYQDRLYINDGTGKFSKLESALSGESTSGSIVAVSDYDKDGDPDIFVGGRHQGKSYPYGPRS